MCNKFIYLSFVLARSQSKKSYYFLSLFKEDCYV